MFFLYTNVWFVVFPEIHRLLGSDFRQHVHLQSRAHLQCTEPSADDLPYRQMSYSCVSVLIPLETDASLQQRYASTWGQVRNGRLLEDMDKLSGIAPIGRWTDSIISFLFN